VSPMSEETVESMSPKEVDKCFVEFPGEMIKCLKNTPNVINYSPDMESKLIGSFYIEERKLEEEEPKTFEVSGVAPNFFDNINFQVMWPRKNQEVPSWYWGEAVETFNIIYDGAIFLAFGESTAVGDGAYTWEFGKEAMKIIRSCFSKSSLFQVTSIGPIMLHPAIYFIFLDPSVGMTLPTTDIKDDDLYVFFRYESEGDCQVMVQHFFDSVAYQVKEHIGNELVRVEILETEEKFRNKFETLPPLHRGLLEMNSWNPVNIPRRYSYTRQLREGICECYELYVELMDLQAYINEQRSRYMSDISKHHFLALLADYFEDQLSDVGKTDLSPILQGLQFFGDETRMVMTGRSSLLAALIGALVASAIYAIASALLGQ